MDRKSRDELNQLSKEVFGTSSRWKKIVENGAIDTYEDENTKIVPNRKTGALETKTFKIPKIVLKRYTVDEVRDLMKSILEARPLNVPKIEESKELEESYPLSGKVVGC